VAWVNKGETDSTITDTMIKVLEMTLVAEARAREKVVDMAITYDQ
jgi:hypothetical protein